MNPLPTPAGGSVEPALAPSPGRIKRQVQAREHRFALVCPPGLEAVCLVEARVLGLSLVPLPGSTAVEAGPILEWTGRLEDLYRACLFLRVASRVLVRLVGFRAGAREELFRHTGDFPWELWLPPGAILKIEAHVRRSRISHEGMAADTVRQAIDRRLGRAGLAPTQTPVGGGFDQTNDEETTEATGTELAEIETRASGTELAQRLIVHIHDNHVRLSLDASGDHLHRRAWRTIHGAAPIRENLAAGLLLWAGWPGISASDRSAEPLRLVDGMCGSGTFAIEAAGLALGLPASGLATRDYAFCHWPSATGGPLLWWRKQRVSRWDGPGVAATGLAGEVLLMISAGDLDPAMVSLARDNESRALGTATIAWSAGDFFAHKPQGRGLLVLNPPYGLRLSDGEGSLYPRICRHLAGNWPDWYILLLGLPETRLGPMTPRLRKQCRFRHGGLTIAAWFFGPG